MSFIFFSSHQNPASTMSLPNITQLEPITIFAPLILSTNWHAAAYVTPPRIKTKIVYDSNGNASPIKIFTQS